MEAPGGIAPKVADSEATHGRLTDIRKALVKIWLHQDYFHFDQTRYPY
jgi:hypothetical protein